MIAGNRNKVWRVVSWLIACSVVLPILLMLVDGLTADASLFSHLWHTVLSTYLSNTFFLAIIVGCLSLFFGVTAAILIAHTNVFGRTFLRWLLMLPLAMPAYLVAYLYTDLFDYAGPVQRSLRDFFQWQSPHDYWFFDLRTLTGAGVILSLVLFPYVYLLARVAFEQQDNNLFKASRLLGLSAQQSFFKVGLPLARPAIAVALSLVLMETLADFATVQYFAVNTLTTAIYDTWLGYGELSTANSLASLLLLFVFAMVLFEQRARANQRHQSNRPKIESFTIELSVTQQILASGFCWLLFCAGFLLPWVLLVKMSIDYTDWQQVIDLLEPAINSVELAVYTASFTTIFALIVVLYKRLHQDKYKVLPVNISGFGYAVPGTVLAMAMLATLGPFDTFLNDFAEAQGMERPGLIFSGSLFAVVFAFIVRFLAIANGTLNSGIEQIPHSLDIAPRSLGKHMRSAIFKIHIPLMKPSIVVAWLLVFVEAMKELPAVLVLRPFNYDTLSTQIYQLISDEQLEQGAIGAILIVLFGLLPIIWLNKGEKKS